ncbi:hypothetical protein AX17_004623 [Amanita inopinata Kibby_2008]|nr:hypothetical protein AX17_004623 [Amanita inopinata Kibby_2008]
MPLNTLTTELGLKAGPVLLETLVKHYFDRLKKGAEDDGPGVQLKQDELLYHQVFNIVKTFLKAASYHTVEEVQGFSNIRTPSPPWVRVVRLLIPLSSCDKAALHLTQALGGEALAKTVVGGVKWWQVRSLDGVEAEWIVAKKDWREAKKRQKMQQNNPEAGTTASPSDAPGALGDSEEYDKAMDEMRCILYFHGGGYYFGSVDQERYSIQRFARKINGRILAVNYRLAPQYPFPCALQDALAAYFYLIEPPPNSDHSPVNPAHIVVAGDSAGGGLALAMLQVLRDVGLPMPAGGVLISPWCDLTHSFPSIHTNTDTDVIPSWGLSQQKPSTLWPPPSDEQTQRVHDSLHSRIRQALHHRTQKMTMSSAHTASEGPDYQLPIHIGSTTAVPSLGSEDNQAIKLVTEDGEALTIDAQVHIYTQNSLLIHPLVSPALSYLGGLPPLFFIASDKEVLRDEVIYTAHKAANPSKYQVHPMVRSLYPPLQGIEDRYSATQVHLQVYDDAAHVLPVLFSFTTPAKYCFRAVATFCKLVTGMKMGPESPITMSNSMPNMTSNPSDSTDQEQPTPVPNPTGDAPDDTLESDKRLQDLTRKPSLKRTLSDKMHRAARRLQERPNSGSYKNKVVDSPSMPPLPEEEKLVVKPRLQLRTSSDVGGPRFRAASSPLPCTEGQRFAGEPSVYGTPASGQLWIGPMIRERVSTQGIIRPLEPESELVACNMPSDVIGRLSERAIRRYLESSAKFNRKFARQKKTVEKHRRQNLDRAEKDAIKNLQAWEDSVTKRSDSEATPGELVPSPSNGGWDWVLDSDEKPPPSSIVARRDTDEARKLAEIADRSIIQGSQSLSANNFWSLVMNFFTVTPDPDNLALDKAHLPWKNILFQKAKTPTENKTCSQ